MPKGFKYDVVQLIHGVRDRPCLWDKTLESYKDRVERRMAWEEIFNMLDEGYERMTWEEQRLTGELVLNKWTNIRDTFVKTLKTKLGRPKKKYLLYDHLIFLKKVIPEEEGADHNDDVPVSSLKQELECEREGTSYNTRKKSKKSSNEDYYAPARKSKKSAIEEFRAEELNIEFDSNDNENIDYVDVDESDPRLMNEDEAFFASLLPTVVKYGEDERLEFRMEVLAVMKRIREKKKWAGGED